MRTEEPGTPARARKRWRLEWAATDTFVAVVAGGVTAVLLVRASRLIGLDITDLLVGALVWMTLGVLWLVTLIHGLRMRTIGRGVLLVPLLTGLLVLLVSLDVPRGARFQLAQPALTAWVEDQPAGPQRPAARATDDDSFETSVGELQDCPRRLGSYRFEGCEQAFEGVLLWAGVSVIHEIGLVRGAAAPEPGDPTSRGSVVDVQQLSDGWYLVSVTS